MEDVFKHVEKEWEHTQNMWNTRLKETRSKQELTQKDFAKMMTTAMYGEGENETEKCIYQQTVYKWENVGGSKGKGNKNAYGFPEFKTMITISKVLNVDLGYLLGETDYETFDMTKAVDFTGLEPTALNNILYFTRGMDSKDIEVKYRQKEYTEIINRLLSSKEFVRFVITMIELSDAYQKAEELSKMNPLEVTMQNMPKELFDEALAVEENPYLDNSPKNTSELSDAVDRIKEAMDEGYMIQCSLEEAQREVKVARFNLNEIFTRWLDSLNLNTTRT